MQRNLEWTQKYKGKDLIVCITLSQLCDPRVGAHLRLHGPELALSCRHRLVMWPYLSHILP